MLFFILTLLMILVILPLLLLWLGFYAALWAKKCAERQQGRRVYSIDDVLEAHLGGAGEYLAPKPEAESPPAS